MNRKVLQAITLALALVLTSMVAWASDYYVSQTGNNTTGDGSRANPWATIAHADSSGKLQPGDTVHVAPGTYTGSFQTYTSGMAVAPITYISDTKWEAVLVGTSGSVFANHADYVQIIGFEVMGNDRGQNGIYTDGVNTVIKANKVHNILRHTCNGSGGSGINLNGPNAQVIGNYVYDIGPFPKVCDYDQGIYFLQPGGIAANNVSFNNAGHGIQLWACSSNELIYNNTLFNNAEGGIVVGANCTNPANQVNDYTVVDNNICYNTTRGIMEEGGYTINGKAVLATGPHNIYHNNLVYGNSVAAIQVQTGIVSGTVTQDPKFVSYTGDCAGCYHLLPNSPALGAGLSSDTTPNGGVVTFIDYDFDGVKRPQNGAFDIGAYQHH